MKVEWTDSEEFYFYGGQYVVTLEDGQEIIVPTYGYPPDDEEFYLKSKEEARVIAEKIAKLLTENK